MPNFYNEDIVDFYEKLSQRGKSQKLKEFPGETLPELVMHVSEGCNLACTYCFADAGMYGNSKKKWMDPQEAKEFIKSIAARYESIGYVKFFGGEPLMNVKAIKEVIATFKLLFEQGVLSKVPNFGMVSNMTIYSKEIRELIISENISITGSLDGPKEINDLGRVYENGRGSFDKIDRTIRAMKKETGEPSSLEVVYGPWHFYKGWTPERVHRFLHESYSIEGIYIVPAFMSKVERKKNLDYVNSLRELGCGYGKFIVNNLKIKSCRDEVISFLKVLTSGRYEGAFCPLGTDTLTIMSSGRVLPCYTLAATNEFDICSDVRGISRSIHRELEVIKVMNSAVRINDQDCQSCSLYKTCRGCPGGNFNFDGVLSGKNPGICDYLIGYHEGILGSIIELHKNGKFSLLK